MQMNGPVVIAELAALYPSYKKALITDDVGTLTEFFWASPLAMRFGLKENLHGFEEIARFRRSRPAGFGSEPCGAWTSSHLHPTTAKLPWSLSEQRKAGRCKAGKATSGYASQRVGESCPPMCRCCPRYPQTGRSLSRAMRVESATDR